LKESEEVQPAMKKLKRICIEIGNENIQKWKERKKEESEKRKKRGKEEEKESERTEGKKNAERKKTEFVEKMKKKTVVKLQGKSEDWILEKKKNWREYRVEEKTENWSEEEGNSDSETTTDVIEFGSNFIFKFDFSKTIWPKRLDPHSNINVVKKVETPSSTETKVQGLL